MSNSKSTEEEIIEGIYRWTIDMVNMSIEAAAKQPGVGLTQPILGTGTAPMLSPTAAKAAIERLIAKRVDEALTDLREEFSWDIDLESRYDFDYSIAESTVKAHNKVINAQNGERAEFREAIDRRLATLNNQTKEKNI